MKTLTITLVSLAAMTGLAMAEQKAPVAKVDTKAAPPAAPAKMETPKPPAEIMATFKQMGPRLRCTGTGLGMDMKTEVKFTGTQVNKVVLDGWFIQMSLNGTIGQGKEAMKMKMESFMTYDAKSGKWRSVSAMNDGSTGAGTSELKDGKMQGTSTMWGMWGESLFRDHGDYTDMKAGAKMWGEMSMDKGKTWTKVYEMTCKK